MARITGVRSFLRISASHSRWSVKCFRSEPILTIYVHYLHLQSAQSGRAGKRLFQHKTARTRLPRSPLRTPFRVLPAFYPVRTVRRFHAHPIKPENPVIDLNGHLLKNNRVHINEDDRHQHEAGVLQELDSNLYPPAKWFPNCVCY